MSAPQQQPRRRRGVILAGLTAAVALGAVPVLVAPRLAELKAAPVQLAEDSGNADAFVRALRTAFDQVEPLKTKVNDGKIIAKFGAKADAVVKDAAASASSVPAEALERALDGALHSLFLRQLAVVSREVFNKFSVDSRPETALKRADAKFEARAKDLVRPGSSWSFEDEREELKAALDAHLRHRKILSEERARTAQTQRATADVIGKLQKNMEQLGEKLRGTGAGSPWIVWTSYHLPGTPLQVSGRYTQGRANIEFNMAKNRDPVNAEAGFVEGVGDTLLGNLGLSLNVGV